MNVTLTVNTTDDIRYRLQALYKARPEHLKVLNFSTWLGLFLSDALNGSL